jgi:holo-[acyl-carrier protein] synthase
MNIIGHGIDFVEIARIADMTARHGERFIERCFTAGERAYCESKHRRRFEHYAARFAAKEAALKALGTGWRDGIAWTDVEVIRRPSGEPFLKITGTAAEIAEERGISGWHLSLSHTDAHAVGSVIATGE